VKILRAYKTELDPNNRQRTLFLQHAGVARFAFNWGLRKKIDAYAATGKSPSAIDLHRELNALKKIDYPWMYESSKCAPQEALRNLDSAFAHFFRRCKKGSKRKGFPKFKSRKRGIGGFRLTGSAGATDRHVQLPRIGKVRLKERDYLPAVDREDVRILSATVTERAGRWFVSFQVEQTIPDPVPPTESVVGVDVGIKYLAVTSDGEVFDNPKALRTMEPRLRTRQKEVSRRVKGSSNRRKSVARLARLHYRISCIRRDYIHKMTTAITKSASTVVLESLNVSGMLRNHRLARALSDAALAEIHRQVKYKMAWKGGTVEEADCFFPSSKMCSDCGNVKDVLSLGERVYECDACGSVIDRDVNAAINLKNLAGSSPVSACCPGSAGPARKSRAKLLVGQEPNAIQGVS